MRQQAKLIIFDLDGTLVDSNRDLVPALNHAIASENIDPVSLNDVGHVVGQGALKMIEKAYVLAGQKIVTGGELHLKLLQDFITYYEAHIADETVFYPGAIECLTELKSMGWNIAVCTNKYEHLARKLLTQLGEPNWFDVVTGGDTFPVKKPDPRHLVETAKLLNVGVERCIMVGDSNNDIAAAHGVPMPVIAVDFGYSDEPVKAYNPTKIISHFDQLIDAVSELQQTMNIS